MKLIKHVTHSACSALLIVFIVLFSIPFYLFIVPRYGYRCYKNGEQFKWDDALGITQDDTPGYCTCP